MVKGFQSPMSCVGNKLFKIILDSIGVFVKCDKKTIGRVNMEEARFFIKTNQQELFNNTMKVVVDGNLFTLFLREDTFMQTANTKLFRDWEEVEESTSSSF